MKSRDTLSEAVIAKHHKRDDSNGVSKKHGKEAREIYQQGPAFSKAIPIQKRHNTKKVIEKFQPADSGTLWNNLLFTIGYGRSKVLKICGGQVSFPLPYPLR